MSNDREETKPDGSWEEETTGFAELGDLLRSGVQDEGSPASAELRSAWSSFVEAARELAQAVAATANDPEIRASVKSAAHSLVETVGTVARDAANTAAERVRSTAERTRKGETAEAGEAGESDASEGEAGENEADEENDRLEEAEETGDDPSA